MKKIWCIADTHKQHGFLDIPYDVDAVIFAGDAGNEKIPAVNEHEVYDFLEWFASLTHIKHKIFIGGNHDTSIESGLITRGSMPESIIYLEHESIEIDGIKIFGSPYTPKFGTGWAWNVPRGKLYNYWDKMPEDIDILVTHTPPKGILDLTTYDTRAGAKAGLLFQCGCEELLHRVRSIQPRYHIFGHIHDEPSCHNSGLLQISRCSTTFVNASVCDFGRSAEELKYKQIVNNGLIIELC